MFASNSFFGFPPLIPFGTEIATPKNEKNVVEKVLEGNERNATGEDERTKSGFILSRQAEIKVRFNPPVFDNVAHFFRSEEAKSLQIPPQKQCFPEGCFRLHTFQIVNFQKPETFTLKPLGPNLLLLNIANFDLNIESLLSGNIQLLLFTPMPVSGNFFVDAQELSIKALFGIQKDGKKQNINKLNNNNSLQTSINNDNDLLFNSENVDNSVLEINNLFDDNLQNITSFSNNFNNFEWRREGSIEIVFTQQTANNLLLKAFRADLLSIYIGQNSPLFGPLLRTSCDLDNVCLGDTIPEASEIYPNEQLELKIVPTKAPILNVTEDLATLSLSGVAIFFLARDPFRLPIAQIPFFTIIELNIGMEYVSLSIPKLEILENADFFQVPIATLQEGFRDSILINFIVYFDLLLIINYNNKMTENLKDVAEAKTDSDSGYIDLGFYSTNTVTEILPFAILIVIILVGSVLWYLKDIKKDVTTIKEDVKTNSETLAAHSVSISALEKGLKDLKKEQKSDNEKLRKEQKEEKHFIVSEKLRKEQKEEIEKLRKEQKERFEDYKKEKKEENENLLKKIGKRFDVVSSDHKKLADKVNEISTDQKVLTANFANLEKTVSDLKDVVSSNSEKLSSNSEKLSDLQHEVSTQKTAIDEIGGTLKTSVDGLCIDMAVIKEKQIMDEGEDQKHKQAIQSFREFTGNQDDSTARRLLSMYNWDVQRAINIFFMRGAPPPEQQQKSDDSDDEDIIVDGDDEIRAVQPSFEPKRRISHFVKKNKNIEKNQTAENKKEDKKDDSEDNIRAPIPAVKGVMLAQSYRQTY
uniref:Lipid-binding serum glycoprotein C-terminal domain-containing protein n=1 Tax=Meloidogyne javanica TaxID=6303 RepID=A0A915MWI8_MELJA